MVLILTLGVVVYADNIDPYNDGSKYAYSENVGWFNFKPTQGTGVLVYGGNVIGYAWQENIGWINLSPAFYGGVTYDLNWNLSGYAWGENIGWINFNPTVPGDPTDYGVSIDDNGNFHGWAWGENIGWIHFNSASPVAYKVRVCVVGADDLRNFAAAWLNNGRGMPADLNGSTHVDFVDYGMFTSNWLDFCPDNWMLK